MRVRTEGEAVLGGGLRVHGRLDPLQGAVPGAQAGGLQAARHAGPGERPLQAAVERQGLQLAVGGPRHPALGRNGAGLEGEVGVSRRVERAARVEPGGAGDEFEPVDPQAAAVGEAERPVELGRAGEHGGGGAGQKALDAGGEIEGEPPLGPDARDPGRPLGADGLAGGEVEAGVPGVQRPAPVEVEVDRRRARHVQAFREQAAGRLVQGGLHLQALALRHEQQPQAEPAAGILPLHRRVEVEPLGGRTELRAPLGREPRRLAGDRFAEDEVGQGEVLDLDLDRQVRQQGAVGLRRRGDGGRHRAPQHVEPADLQGVDLEPSGQEREAPPDDAGPVELQPDPVAVADRHVADRGVRRERAVDGADGDARTRRGQGAGEETAEHGLLGLVGGVGDGSRGRKPDDEEKGQDGDAHPSPPSRTLRDHPPQRGEGFPREPLPDPHQNDCPRLM